MSGADRTFKQGGIFSYVHHNNRIGVLLELHCNTDRVAQSEPFLQLANELSLHIAATDPAYIDFENVPIDIIEKTRQTILQNLSLKQAPQEEQSEIIDNELKRELGEQVLMMQPWVKDGAMLIGDLVRKVSAEVGAEVIVYRFKRYSLGE